MKEEQNKSIRHSVVNLVNIHICIGSLITDTLQKLCCETETITMAMLFPFSVSFVEHVHALVSLPRPVSVPSQRCYDSKSEMSHLHPGLSLSVHVICTHYTEWVVLVPRAAQVMIMLEETILPIFLTQLFSSQIPYWQLLYVSELGQAAFWPP